MGYFFVAQSRGHLDWPLLYVRHLRDDSLYGIRSR